MIHEAGAGLLFTVADVVAETDQGVKLGVNILRLSGGHMASGLAGVRAASVVSDLVCGFVRPRARSLLLHSLCQRLLLLQKAPSLRVGPLKRLVRQF